MNDGGWTEANVVAAAVRIVGGAQKVADSLGVSRSQVYRWIKARTMARATYFYVAKLAILSGIDTGFLGGDGSLPLDKEPSAKLVHSPKARSTSPNLKVRRSRVHMTRNGERSVGIKPSTNGSAKAGFQEAPDRLHIGDELARIEGQKGGIQQNCLAPSNGGSPGGGDHYGRRRTVRIKQEESREDQP